MEKVLCKNDKCSFWKVGEKEYFIKTRGYVPFKDSYFTGICGKSCLKLKKIYVESRNYCIKFVSCGEGKNCKDGCGCDKITCNDADCIWNVNGVCDRTGGIAIEAIPYGSGDATELSCRAQSQKKISGHLDFFRFLGQKSSHIDDPPNYSDRFWSRKEEEIKQLKKQGIPQEELNTIYGRDVH